jgi:hypothetical protein
MSAPRCHACGSAHVTLRGRKTGTFHRREFEFHACADCGLMFVLPFSGFEIYNDAYYRGEGPDEYVDYEAEYHNWMQSDRVLEISPATTSAPTPTCSRPQTASASSISQNSPANPMPRSTSSA